MLHHTASKLAAIAGMLTILSVGVLATSDTLSNCVFCAMVMPECPPCARGYTCKVTQPSCHACPVAFCAKESVSLQSDASNQGSAHKEAALQARSDRQTGAPSSCASCPKTAPQCPSCAEDEYCEIRPTSCAGCGNAQCRKIAGSKYGQPDGEPVDIARRRNARRAFDGQEYCVACLRHANCPRCGAGMQCELTLQSCSSCSSAVCASRGKSGQQHGTH
ncbi:hypothetical protein THASP1DRAFT_33674 [Thamnocephalis sphaerospora]|uniref:Membrane anchor Opy2 N-terminal domain-containing protein n=1 Tax=Thamnocephalis sphaerospora TaxID=78915 RepID=A0A4P9XG25_9FUNG|nr:hypothetical protein THASP1DRAFT_33674 [Thamnocephalis sphaerospora]|eukprot:RKP04547.1 hypothetical protein THASP1DRAFT_33674 [Thamnocephalis sphaerospora]